MLRALPLALAAVAATAACKSKSAAPPAPPPPQALDAAATPPAVDADVPEPTSGADEPTLRAGKRTGLASPTELPEVATEEFVTALLAGTQPWTRVIDRKFGVVELRTLDDAGKPVPAVMGRQCGATLDPALARLGKVASTALADAALGYQLVCDNSGLAPAAGIPVATCAIDADADGALGFDLLFVPDATLGLRLVGVTLLDATPPPTAIADSFDEELGRVDARCP
ncbi:MAG: hypothetical protein JNK64_17580 [Myxococcales bacterium]|nr:hypothetical protein [Myxococcales bacterium]